MASFRDILMDCKIELVTYISSEIGRLHGAWRHLKMQVSQKRAIYSIFLFPQVKLQVILSIQCKL